MTSVKRATRKESAPVLDSYHPDEESPYEVFEEKNKEKKGRNMLHKIVSTKFSGGRSKSADRHTDHIPKKVKCQCKKIQVELGECECKRVQKVREKYDGYIKHFQIKLQAKESTVQDLAERINGLQQLNDQYANENDRLQQEASLMKEELDACVQMVEQLKDRSCSNCVELKQSETEWRECYERLSKETKGYKDDIKMLKTLVYRLNVQLEQHQEMLRNKNNDTTRSKVEFEVDNHANIEAKWGSVTTHALAPLLNAYEETVRDKQQLVQQYEKELNEFTGKLKKIVEENEKLHDEIEKIQSSERIWATEKTRLEAQIDVCRKKAETQTKRADIAKEKLVEVLKFYEQKVQSQSLDLERIQEAYARTRGELTSLKNVQQNPGVVVESMKECQRLFEDLKHQHDTEKNQFNEKIEKLQHSLAEKECKLEKSENDVKELKSLVHRQKQTYDLLQEKNAALKQNLYRIRRSRESLRRRLKTALTFTTEVEGSKTQIKETWHDLNSIDAILSKKEMEIQQMQRDYKLQIERMRRKLMNRDETLKKVLQDRVKRRS